MKLFWKILCSLAFLLWGSTMYIAFVQNAQITRLHSDIALTWRELEGVKEVHVSHLYIEMVYISGGSSFKIKPGIHTLTDSIVIETDVLMILSDTTSHGMISGNTIIGPTIMVPSGPGCAVDTTCWRKKCHT